MGGGKRSSRREALQVLGSAGATLLVGCGGRDSVLGALPDDAPGGGGIAGSGGSSAGGTSGSGGSTLAGGSGGVGGVGAGGSGAGGSGAGGSGSGGMPPGVCNVRPRQVEGPYFVDERLQRVDIRSDPSTGLVKEGIPLRVILRVNQLREGTCAPLPGVLVDLWQCDAQGIYSDVLDAAGRFDTRGHKFLRGFQLSRADGSVEFLTIYPGWYPGRTVHLHFKVRTSPPALGGFQFVSQLYFDQAVTDAVLRQPPYDLQAGTAVPNSADGIFRSGGERLMLALSASGDGFLGQLDLALDMG